MRKLFVLPIAAAICLASCKKSDSTPAGTFMNASVNGHDWSASNVHSRYDIVGTQITLVIIGELDSTGQMISIHVENFAHGKGIIDFTETHHLDPSNTQVTADAAYSNPTSFNVASSGQLTITNVTAQKIEGTFYFKGPGASASNGFFSVATPQ